MPALHSLADCIHAAENIENRGFTGTRRTRNYYQLTLVDFEFEIDIVIGYDFNFSGRISLVAMSHLYIRHNNLYD